MGINHVNAMQIGAVVVVLLAGNFETMPFEEGAGVLTGIDDNAGLRVFCDDAFDAFNEQQAAKPIFMQVAAHHAPGQDVVAIFLFAVAAAGDNLSILLQNKEGAGSICEEVDQVVPL